ncbi:Uncharacterised protein [Salmonella enterica subsp. enterica]|nr:Uncharacterised protein [Salmonella enterica subsp. enterica]
MTISKAMGKFAGVAGDGEFTSTGGIARDGRVKD